ncbi:MAG TPA: (Fe-S)-binding protein [Nitrospirota bacterium]|nr:(Fe-S)-binding protein [Nitrospirota bacterium]
MQHGVVDLNAYAGLLAYERRGTSRRYTWYGMPAGCDTVFFPGCALPGTRPEQTKKLFTMLCGAIPNLGIVLDCCTKPSLSLGRQQYFETMFGELKTYLVENGIRTVLAACPNCYKVFSEHAPELTVRSVYEILSEADIFARGAEKLAGTVTIHDPCVSRFSGSLQKAARALVAGTGLAIQEMQSSGRFTVCCGEGGAVGCLNPDLAGEWTSKRANESAGRTVVTYCAGCTHYLSARMTASHVVDLLFDPHAALSGRARVSRAPMTYINRLRLKWYFRKKMEAAISRERKSAAGNNFDKEGTT